MNKLDFDITDEIKDALLNKKPIVALESTLISHGLPYPKNLQVAKASIEAVKSSGSIPATIAIIEGKIKVGLNEEELNILSTKKNIEKASVHNLAIFVKNKNNAATTVASSIYIAALVGIKFFATGGIGGVHLESEKTFDISSDLHQLSKTKMNIVSSGPKSILDINKTFEMLETFGVPRIGFNTNYMPGFWYYQTDKRLDYNYIKISDLVSYIKTHENLKQNGSILIFNPVPKDKAIKKESINEWIDISIRKAKKESISGKDLTPFLINEINNLSNNQTLETNAELIINNALIAGNLASNYF